MNPARSKPKALLIDFGGTLDADGEHWRSRFYQLFCQRGYRIDARTFDRAYFDADNFLPQCYPLRSMGFRETVRALADSLCRNLPGTGSLARDIAEEFCESSMGHAHRNKDVLILLKERFHLAIVSNYYGNLDNALLEVGLLSLLDAAIDSRWIGAQKPEPAIFWAALNKLRVDPADTLFIGDSFERDIAGAWRLGISALWLVNANSTVSFNHAPGIPQIHSFTELPAWLGVDRL